MGIGIVVPDVAIGFFATALKGAQELLETAATTPSSPTRTVPPSGEAARPCAC